MDCAETDDACLKTSGRFFQTGMCSVVAFDFAVEPVNAAAVGAFDGAVGLNRQEHARVAVPSFMFGAGAVQRQVVRGNDYFFLLGGLAHNRFLVQGWFYVRYCTIFGVICAAPRNRTRSLYGNGVMQYIYPFAVPLHTISTKDSIMTRLSVLNLAPVRAGQNHAQAIEAMVRLAQNAERLGYARYWIAEHHNMANLASSSTQLLIGHTLAQTERIRVGSGGVMLPNHSPLMVAEQYGTLATIYPGRVDLGLGRAPGTDQITAAALRRNERDVSLNFPHDVRQLQRYFGPPEIQGPVRAFPGVGLDVPLYILGSSTESAYLAAELGLPYVFAAHFAPRFLEAALEIYRREFKPSAVLDRPEVIVALNVIAAGSDEEAQYLATTQQQFFLNVVRHSGQPLQPPVESMEGLWTEAEQAVARQMLGCSLIGGPDSIAAQYEALQARLRADELMVVSYIFDEAKQADSYRLLREAVAADS